jgi:hypothetical protein
VLIDRYAADEPRGYPTLCKGRFDVGGLSATTRWKNPPA